MDKNEEKHIEGHSKIDDVFAFIGFRGRRFRKLGGSAVRITQKTEDMNNPPDETHV